MYSVTTCKQEYLAKYRDLIIQETSLKVHIRPSVSEEGVDDLRRLEQNLQTSLTKFPQQSGIPVATIGIDERITEYLCN